MAAVLTSSCMFMDELLSEPQFLLRYPPPHPTPFPPACPLQG